MSSRLPGDFTLSFHRDGSLIAQHIPGEWPAWLRRTAVLTAWMNTGEGLFSFRNLDEAAHALNEISRDYPRHSRAARKVAEDHLDARKVLASLIDQAV